MTHDAERNEAEPQLSDEVLFEGLAELAVTHGLVYETGDLIPEVTEREIMAGSPRVVREGDGTFFVLDSLPEMIESGIRRITFTQSRFDEDVESSNVQIEFVDELLEKTVIMSVEDIDDVTSGVSTTVIISEKPQTAEEATTMTGSISEQDREGEPEPIDFVALKKEVDAIDFDALEQKLFEQLGFWANVDQSPSADDMRTIADVCRKLRRSLGT